MLVAELDSTDGGWLDVAVALYGSYSRTHPKIERLAKEYFLLEISTWVEFWPFLTVEFMQALKSLGFSIQTT